MATIQISHRVSSRRSVAQQPPRTTAPSSIADACISSDIEDPVPCHEARIERDADLKRRVGSALCLELGCLGSLMQHAAALNFDGHMHDAQDLWYQRLIVRRTAIVIGDDDDFCGKLALAYPPDM